MDINDIISLLQSADRLGKDTDNPEGTRYIQLSETLVNQIITVLSSGLDYDPFNAYPLTINELLPVDYRIKLEQLKD